MRTIFKALTLIIFFGIVCLLLVLVSARLSNPKDYKRVHDVATKFVGNFRSDAPEPSVEVEGQNPNPLTEDDFEDGASGGANFNFQRDNEDTLTVINSPSAGMDVPTFALIAERVKGNFPAQKISQSETQKLSSLVNRFLMKWENFSPDSQSQYAKSLVPLIDPQIAQRVIERKDNRHPEEVGPCKNCTVGSYLHAQYGSPGDAMRIRSYSDQWAYVTTQAYVEYIGGDVYSGIVLRRSYGIILHKFAGEWRVARVAAETLGPAQ